MLYSSTINQSFQMSGESITIPIVKAGTLARLRGTKKIGRLTKEALESGATSWEGGYINVNHQVPETGQIAKSWYENDYVIAEVTGLSDKAKEVIQSPAYSGVSQECEPLEISDTPSLAGSREVYDVTKLEGRGVAIMVYPHQPQCKLSEGCGVLASEDVNTLPEKLYEYDVSRINNTGRTIKTREISIWMYGDDVNNQDKLKERIVQEVYGMIGSIDIYERNSQLQIGDEILGANPVHTVDIAVSGEVTVQENVILPLNTNSKNNLIDSPEGGDGMEETEIKALTDSIALKDAEIASLKTSINDLTGKLDEYIAKQPELMKVAASAAVDEYKGSLILDKLMSEAKLLMSEEVFTRFEATKPDIGAASATIDAIKASLPKPGATSGQVPEEHEPTVQRFGAYDPATKSYRV